MEDALRPEAFHERTTGPGIAVGLGYKYSQGLNRLR
jgi:hypothetical protein